MRRLLILISLAAVLAIPGRAYASPVFLISGAGWGHGIGLAQYGAYGFAQHGWTHDQILAHYYPGTELGQAAKARIRVLLATGAATATISSDAPFFVKDAQGKVSLRAGSYTLGPDLTLEVSGERRAFSSPVRFQPGKAPLRLKKAYRGALVVTAAGNGLTVVNDVGLEPYLKGVVAGEMPPDWHPEALAAQAVAARSYALASRRKGGLFDVYADTRSQVYGGIAAEDPRSSAAVDATRRQIVLYEGKVAWTFFSASSGGRTAAIQDVWPDAEPEPYLVPVEDPYDDVSPYHRWGPVAFTAEELEAKLGDDLPADLQSLTVNLNGSGRVASVTAVGAGGQTEISGWRTRIALGLRSTWFSIDELTVEPSARRVVYGDRVTLAGVLSGLPQAVLEARAGSGPWQKLATVEPGEDGAFSVSHEPAATTFYRLRAAGVAGPAIRVRVAPKVTLKHGPGATLGGSVRPAAPGRAVTIQRRGGRAWTTVATTTVGARSSYRVSLRVAPGKYRARIAASDGLAAATSPVLVVAG